MADTLFTKIIKREIPATIVHEDEKCVVIRDINPQAPTHLLFIPRKPIPHMSEATEADRDLLGHLLITAAQIAKKEDLDAGYRLVINNGRQAGESVSHLHLHLLGGRPFHWPPG